jgi:hypothetical protein
MTESDLSSAGALFWKLEEFVIIWLSLIGQDIVPGNKDD